MSDHTHDNDDGHSESSAYETRDVKIRPLAQFVAGLTIVALAVYFVVFAMMRLFNAEANKQDAAVAPASSLSQPARPGEERLPPEPRIQANPAGDLATLRAQEDAVLTTYGWVDRQAGVVRVPVDVAMKLVLEHGLPVRQPKTPLPATGTPASSTTPQGQGSAVKAEK